MRYKQTIFLSPMPLILEPPNYNDSLSLPSPSYSSVLANGEQTLDYTPRSQTGRSPSTGVFIKESREFSVVLDGQAVDATIPVFGRSAVISGTVLCHDPPGNIREIVLKVYLISLQTLFDPFPSYLIGEGQIR